MMNLFQPSIIFPFKHSSLFTSSFLSMVLDLYRIYLSSKTSSMGICLISIFLSIICLRYFEFFFSFTFLMSISFSLMYFSSFSYNCYIWLSNSVLLRSVIKEVLYDLLKYLNVLKKVLSKIASSSVLLFGSYPFSYFSNCLVYHRTVPL